MPAKQNDRAEEQAKAVLAQKPDNADAYALLSTISAVKGDKADALVQIQHALALDPSRPSFHTALGLLQETDPANSGQGEEQLRKAVSLDNKNVTSHLALAALLDKKGDVTGAVDQGKAAVAADPKNMMARASLAEIYEQKGDKANAEATLRQAAEDTAETPGGGAQLLQNFYLRTGQLDRGVQVFGELSRKHPKSLPLKLTYTRFCWPSVISRAAVLRSPR